MLTMAAPAKLNLYLHVTGRRADGYHLLDGLVAFADIYDTLTFAPGVLGVLGLTADGPFAADMGDDPAQNLVIRAALALAAAAGRDPEFRIHLTKRLPVASGIGGGSADAAACLRALCAAWGIDPASALVRRVAAGLGSDIPVCVTGRAAFISGIGVDLVPAPRLPDAGIVLVNPGIALPTPSVYRARSSPFSPPMRFETPPTDAADLARLLQARKNDLTQPAIALEPAIEAVLAAIESSPGCLLARMSGSGATCFGLYAGRAAAGYAAAAIRDAHPGWWVAAGRLIDDTNALTAV